jgi:hypothetical protein
MDDQYTHSPAKTLSLHFILDAFKNHLQTHLMRQ